MRRAVTSQAGQVTMYGILVPYRVEIVVVCKITVTSQAGQWALYCLHRINTLCKQRDGEDQNKEPYQCSKLHWKMDRWVSFFFGNDVIFLHFVIEVGSRDL